MKVLDVKYQKKITKKDEKKYLLEMGKNTFDRCIEPITVYDMKSGKIIIYDNNNKIVQEKEQH